MQLANRKNSLIYTELLTDRQRVDYTARLFSIDFPMQLEPAIFALATQLSPDYQGGYWSFHALSNGGFYMAPAEGDFRVQAPNGFAGVMSADAFGLTVCLYAYSSLSFGGGRLGAACADHFHRLRALAIDCPDWRCIASAID